MAAYMIAQLRVHDVATYRTYALQVAKTVAPFGGRLIVAADDPTVLEGAPPFPRTVIGEFASTAQARAWYESAAYQAIQPLRAASTEGTIFIAEGFGLPDRPQTAPSPAEPA
jgi:uncharacterized protein (DUF1330 family)